MARLLPVTLVTLGCLSLLYLQLPGALPLGQGGSRQPARPRGAGCRVGCRPACPLAKGQPPAFSKAWAPPARTLARGLQLQHPAPRPVIHKPPQALQPQRGASLLPAASQHLRGGPRRHLGPPRPRAQLLRAGCVLSACQVQNLSHRLWQLVASAGPRDPAPMGPSSPYSYG